MGRVKQIIRELIKKFPSWHQWQKVPSVLTKKERYFVLGFLILAIVSLFGWMISYNLKHTILVPNYGGSFSEGIVGNPQYINPILSQTNDADRDLSELIFSGLMKYDSRGNLVADLAEKYNIGDNGKVYEFFLKKNIKWHDRAPLTADDVVFTIGAIQNPDYRSALRINWSGVEVEKVDDWTVRFKLKTPYAPFLSNTTVGILPSHIWKSILPEKFLLAPENLTPVGTGPYQLGKMKKDKEGFISYVELEAFGDYNTETRPFIEKIQIYFYPSEEELIKAYNRGKPDNLTLISNQNKNLLRGVNVKSNTYRLNLPRYFSVFFNQSKSKVLSDKNVRLALNYATNKKEIIEKALNGEGTQVDSPIPSGTFGQNEKIKIYEFNPEKAKEILEQAGWKDADNDGIREKKEEKLEIELVTTELNQLQQTAEILKEQWAKIGAKVNIIISNIGEIQQEYIRPREYQAILFGEVLGLDPDPYSFWHSSQKKEPGLNLALYDNQKVDVLLKDARQVINNDELRAKEYEQFQQLIIDDAPVVFLYSPYQLYFTAKKIKGVEVENIVLPSKRFADIQKWYIKTQRIKKSQ
ncbi:MAG: ABC transporter substrate-binding protein [bacterium]|nr:ABC transporter substrate-binding protein [bacterium]